MKQQKENKNPVGRPSELLETLEKAKEYVMGGWETFGDVIPSIAGLACYTGKRRSTIYEYGNQSKEFSDILEGLLSMQENKLLNGGLKGFFNPTISKLILTKHGYSDKQEVSAHVTSTELPLVGADEFI